MKKIFTLLFVSVFAFTSCSDDGVVGPPGPPGPPGEDGGLEFAQVVEYEGVNFTADDSYSLEINFNDAGLEVFETDAVFVYIKTGEDGTADGLPVEVFRLLPQTYFLDEGVLQYNYDFTFFEVLVFLDGTIDFASLDAQYTNDRVIRIVVVPAEFASSGVDMSNMDAVLNELKINDQDIKKANF